MEPPAAPTIIPLVGHLYGLYSRKFEYYADLAKKTDEPIVTLNLPGQKIYAVLDPKLIQVIQKQYIALSFTPIQAKFSSVIANASQQSIDALNAGITDEGDIGVHVAVRAAMRDGTSTGREVDKMNREMISEVAQQLDALSPSADGGVATIELYSWLKNALSIATSNSVWGPHNPYKDPEMLRSYWEFEQGMMSILLMPAMVSRKYTTARDRVASAFETYYKNNHHEEASLIARGRYHAMASHNIPLHDLAKFETLATVAFLVNTIPAAFWLLFYIHSIPNLLSKIRTEIDANIRTKTDPTTNHKTHSLDITSIKHNCPLLLSTYQETLRHHGMSNAVREVTRDTILLDKYLLKKGALIQMPTRPIHTDRSTWGADVDDFRPARFLKGEKHQTLTGRPASDTSFRAFGGGKTLCPGRHFATNEVLAVAATWVSRFDMVPSSSSSSSSAGAGGGTNGWTKPTSMNTSMASALMTPDTDIRVDITRRAGFEDGEWWIGLTDSDEVVPLVVEDREGGARN